MSEEKSEEIDLKEIPEEVVQAVGEDLKEKTSKVIVHSDPPIPPGAGTLQRLGSPEPPPMPSADITMTQVLAMAVQKDGFDVAALTALVSLKERLDAEENRKKFNAAFAKAQSEIEPIVARKDNKHTQSKYAALEDINKTVTPVASKHGFSTTFKQGKAETDGLIRIIGNLAHKAGHVEEYYIDLPVDDKGSGGKSNKTVVQGTGSTFSYGRRYLVCMMFNVAIVGEDNDGNAAGGKVADDTITKEQAEELEGLIKKDSGLLQTVLSTYNEQYPVEFLADLKSKDFQNCKNRIAKYNEAHK